MLLYDTNGIYVASDKLLTVNPFGDPVIGRQLELRQAQKMAVISKLHHLFIQQERPQTQQSDKNVTFLINTNIDRFRNSLAQHSASRKSNILQNIFLQRMAILWVIVG
jgi:hypothetical protein